MDTTKKQSNKTGPAGKKRKKKSKKEREISGQPKGVSASKGGDHKSKTKSSDSNPLSSALTICKLEDQCSTSNSSIETQRPLHKLKRYDDSSDTMSSTTRDSQLVHSDITTESGTDTSSMSYSSLTTKCKPLQEEGDKTSLTRSLSDETRPNKLEIDAKVRLESLRWENEVSDEEQERVRIEEYKMKRRHRYQQALTLQREQLATRTTTRKHYYYYSN